MSDETVPGDARSAFELALIKAITEGRPPGDSAPLGVHTLAAVEAIAREHPEAAAHLIAVAYDAFQGERGAVA
ncbi:hypothetical protein CIW49_05970 [Mycolicibacterium sp. P1-18]|uniref:hypothetical protein n=1 Tax=Mycolicibacterium sp. P1-18 TaxID=2024615 RepID=UPI0011F29AE8|nr:hypothetical protein [Mycolicibacterium sp. P1-18]KAA0101053.1 hypothetical protein CIW49_05970 [Mycolicibacterium sp. P1-18]